MQRLWRMPVREQRGSALVFFAAIMAGFVVMSAMAVDVGRLYVYRQQLKVVADGAVLAAARSLPDSVAATSAAQDIFDRNGISVSGVSSSVAITNAGAGATVTLTRTVPTLFARILGVAGIVIPATSSAVSAPATSITGIVPLGVANQSFSYGELVTMKFSSPNQLGTPGSFGAVSLGGTGASNYENNLDIGYGQPVRVGDLLGLETGDMAGPTQRGIAYRINQVPNETWTTFSTGSPRLVFVPILDYANESNGQAPVLGFAAFFLESGSGSSISGRFLREVADAGLSSGGTDYGLRVAKLS